MRSAAPRKGAVIVPTTTIRSPSRGSVSRPRRRRSRPSGYQSAAISQAKGKSAIQAKACVVWAKSALSPRICRSRLLVSVALM